MFPVIFRTKHFPMKPYYGISLCGFFFFRKDVHVSDSDIRHETIHYLQQREWLFIGFFLLYAIEFLWHLITKQSWHRAYYAISFEREAYAHQNDKTYLKTRKYWANYRVIP